jgi:ribosomal protein S27AE
MKSPVFLVAEAIRKGVLIRKSCERCGAAKTDAHHEDYSKPLDVIWLCRKCHQQRHRELRQGSTEFVAFPYPRYSIEKVASVRIEPATKRALERIAETEGRSLSSLINKIATDWVAGYDAAQKPAKIRKSA